MTLKLHFEPAGRPGEDRGYYLQNKENICVVCGTEENCVRKNIVPHEYRRYHIAIAGLINHTTVLVHSSCWEICLGNRIRLGCVRGLFLHHALVINPGYSDLSSFFTSPDCFRQSSKNTCHMTCC